MFDSICLKPTTLDFGLLAEAMLFYTEVRLLANHVILKQLLTQAGVDATLAFIEEGFLSIDYLENIEAIHTRQYSDGSEVHKPVIVAGPKYMLQNYAPNVFEDITLRSGHGRRLGKRLQRLVKPIRYERSLDDLKADIEDHHYVKEYLTIILNNYCPGYTDNIEVIFNINVNGGNITIDSNIDFRTANEIYHRYYPREKGTLSHGYILHVMTIPSQIMYWASRYDSEIVASDEFSKLIGLKYSRLISSVYDTREEIDRFHEISLESAYTVAEAINSKYRTAQDLLDLLRSARRFKTWLRGQGPDQKLIASYYREITSSTWAERLPGKSLKWAIMTGAGLALDKFLTG
jgi:hypothetical protein